MDYIIGLSNNKVTINKNIVLDRKIIGNNKKKQNNFNSNSILNKFMYNI